MVPATTGAPSPARSKTAIDRLIAPDAGLARLPYGRAPAPLAEHTAVRGPGTGRDPHEYRRSALTRLGEQGVSLLVLMAKSRHRKPENARRCLEPSPEGIAELTGLLAPGGSTR